MTMLTALTSEFDRETATTRKHLERLPVDKFDWRPHAKSFTAGELAAHIIECIGFADPILSAAELDLDPGTYKPYHAASSAELLDAFDARVRAGKSALATATDATLAEPWRFKIMGRLRFERPRAAVFRDFTLSHLIHHRGQFSVYLRLLDLPVPGSYGPTADEKP